MAPVNESDEMLILKDEDLLMQERSGGRHTFTKHLVWRATYAFASSEGALPPARDALSAASRAGGKRSPCAYCKR